MRPCPGPMQAPRQRRNADYRVATVGWPTPPDGRPSPTLPPAIHAPVLFWLPFAVAATSDCTAPRSLAELRDSNAFAERAWGEDAAVFDEAAAALEPTLACVIEVIPPTEAARVHRLRGLLAFRKRDLQAATAAFAAARELDPEYRFPEALVPEGNPVDTLYRNARAATELRSFDAPKRGWTLRLNGAEAAARNEATPAVIQVVDPVGRVQSGAWIAEHAALPAYPTWREGLRTPLVVAGLSAVAVGAGLWGFGAATRPDPASLTTASEGQAAEARQAAIGGGAIGAAALGLGTIGVGFAVGRW